jgi:hypothetical protein
MEYVTVASALACTNSAVIGRLCGLDALGIVFRNLIERNGFSQPTVGLQADHVAGRATHWSVV